MIPSLRQAYNASYTNDRYSEYRRRMEERGGMEIPFRLAESPVFLPPRLRDEMVEASLEIFRQLSRTEALERSKAAVPRNSTSPAATPCRCSRSPTSRSRRLPTEASLPS